MVVSARKLAPGLLLAVLTTAVAYGAASFVPTVSSLVWALIFGAVVANVLGLPANVEEGIGFAARPLLKVGVVLLGFGISISDALALGPKVLLVILVTVPVTFAAAIYVGRMLGLSSKLSLLIGTGSAICGASAIAAMDSVTDADERDVGFAIATVTLFGTVAVFVLPQVAGALMGLPGKVSGVWAGASVHEVGQVVAAATPLGPEALDTATLVKLTRVVMLAPCILLASLLLKGGTGEGRTGKLPVPVFVLGFLVALAVRSTGILPGGVVDAILTVDTVLLTVALAGLGLKLDIRSMTGLGWRPLALGLSVSVVISLASLGMILWVGV